jgi:hypothetical protein
MNDRIRFFVVFSMLAVAAAAQGRDEAYAVSPEQFRGQLASVRLSVMYPVLVPASVRPPVADAAGLLNGFLADAEAVLKNSRGLTSFLVEGLRSPAAARGLGDRWPAAWRNLDLEVERLRALAAEGEDLLRRPAAADERGLPRGPNALVEDFPEFDSADGARLHRALVWDAYVRNLRSLILLRGAQAAGRENGPKLRSVDTALSRSRRQAGARTP